jgi:UrcA family protein
VRVLYRRIDTAAWRVCGQLFAVTASSGIDNVECRQTLINAAVQEVDRPMLTTLHTKHGTKVTARR